MKNETKAKSGAVIEAEVQQCEVRKEKNLIFQESDLKGKNMNMSVFHK